MLLDGSREEVAVGASDFVEEGTEFGRILAAGACLDAAGDIDSVRAYDANRFGDIFGREAAGKDDPVGLRDETGEVPVRKSASAAKLPGLRGVDEQARSGTVLRVSRRGGSLPDAQRLQNLDVFGDLVNSFRRFVAMKLRGVEMQGAAKRDNGSRFPVDEDSNNGHERRHAIANVGGSGWSDRARALLVEVEADGVGAEFDGESGIFELGDSTDFDADHKQ